MAKGTDVLSDYDEVFLECRDLLHAWERVGAPWREGNEVKRRLVCMRCHSEGVDTWRPGGRRAKGRRYGYVEGYLIPASEGKVTKVDVRVVVMDRMSVYASEEAMHEALFTKTNRSKK